MTTKLYYEDVYCRSFTAEIVEQQETERGAAVRLARSAFYPTSGGQPHDLGTLGGVRVRDVWVDDDGEIWHLLEQGTPEVATEIQGELDWQRRLDHMQQHSGQHLLSAAFIRLREAPTVGFHLGSEASTLDLDLARLSWESAFKVENEVNGIIWQNRPVVARFVTDEELERLELRRDPQVTGDVRVVTVEGYDTTPCGGTHVRRTGEIGVLKITGLERYKGGTRVTFVCGRRALEDYRRALQTLQQASLELTVGQDELPEAVVRLREEGRETRYRLNKARDALLDVEAEELWSSLEPVEDQRVLVRYWPERPFAEVQGLASRLRERPATLVLLAGGENGVRVVCGRSDDLGAHDAGEILRAAVGALGGRGGGSPVMAQGGAPPAAPEAVREALRQAVGSAH